MGVIVFSGHSMGVAMLGTFDGGNKITGDHNALIFSILASYSGTRDIRGTLTGGNIN